MLSVLKKSIYLIILSLVLVYATPQLVIENDDRTVIEVAEFGFLKGGQLTLTLDELKWDKKEEGIAAFYIRKGWILEDDYNIDYSAIHYNECFLNNSFIKDEVNDGASIVEILPNELTSIKWTKNFEIKEGEEGLWQVLYINCKKSAISFKLSVIEVNPNGNYLSAGDIPLPYVYAFSSLAYLLAAAYWCSLLIFKKNKRVFRAHWLMFVLLLFIVINKALQSAKFHYMRLGLLSEGWKIGYYVFACVKGILSLLIIVLLASGWMFIKPFLSSRDKKIISIIIPLQVLANVASAIGTESAIGSADWSFWNMMLPLIDLISCGIILWTIIQTRKHLASATSVDGKEQDILNKYKLWSSFYVVTLVYIYITRIVVQLFQASLPFQYVTWAGEAVNEVATFLFYIFIGYKFRPYPDNPYMQVPDDEEDNEDGNEEDDGYVSNISMNPVNRRDRS
ncbi:hypothetical protein INT46_005004 [Mucor plumbeus]|uniref:GOST seven transmembrane domain-containing protein n=1 Tax=Mucor plumbeus TaxID=97098 RepID=A0A8H7QGT1_9FUNG|nr:hypothetical protein INT46_005004 [Mucor plumbeus]